MLAASSLLFHPLLRACLFNTTRVQVACDCICSVRGTCCWLGVTRRISFYGLFVIRISHRFSLTLETLQCSVIFVSPLRNFSNAGTSIKPYDERHATMTYNCTRVKEFIAVSVALSSDTLPIYVDRAPIKIWRNYMYNLIVWTQLEDCIFNIVYTPFSTVCKLNWAISRIIRI